MRWLLGYLGLGFLVWSLVRWREPLPTGLHHSGTRRGVEAIVLMALWPGVLALVIWALWADWQLWRAGIGSLRKPEEAVVWRRS